MTTKTITKGLWYSIPIKPLSANNMWYGQKRETTEYRNYKKTFISYFKGLELPDKEVRVKVVVGHSSKLFDLDNVFKPLFDSLQKAVPHFNDRYIYEILAKKKLVKKGEEYLKFKVEELTEDEIRKLTE